MNMQVARILISMFLLVVAIAYTQGNDDKKSVSFKKEVFPIINAKCLPCHAEDNFNPSELSMDSYEMLAKGGKNGAPFKPEKSTESLIVKKLGEKPPFGDRMPLNSKRKIAAGKAVWLTPEELSTIATWIDKGAKNN